MNKRVNTGKASKNNAKQNNTELVVQHSTMVSILAARPSCPRFDSQRSRNFFGGKIITVADVNQQRWLEESGQRLENFD